MVALVQAMVPAEMQGRVLSVGRGLAWAAMPLGLAVAGPLSDIFGLRLWWVAGGLGMSVLGIAGRLTPGIANLEGRRQNQEAADLRAALEPTL